MVLLCISVFGFVQLTAAVKLLHFSRLAANVSRQKPAKVRIFSADNRSSCQLLVAPQTLDPDAKRKPYT